MEYLVITVSVILGGALFGGGVYLGFRMGYEAKTGVLPAVGVTSFDGAVLDPIEPEGEALDE